MEDSQYDQARTVEAILEYVRCIKDLQHKLPIFLASGNCAPELRKCRQYLRFVDDRLGDYSGNLWMVFVEENGKPIEVCERVERPFYVYWCRHGLNAEVPHVLSQRTT